MHAVLVEDDKLKFIEDTIPADWGSNAWWTSVVDNNDWDIGVMAMTLSCLPKNKPLPPGKLNSSMPISSVDFFYIGLLWSLSPGIGPQFHYTSTSSSCCHSGIIFNEIPKYIMPFLSNSISYISTSSCGSHGFFQYGLGAFFHPKQLIHQILVLFNYIISFYTGLEAFRSPFMTSIPVMRLETVTIVTDSTNGIWHWMSYHRVSIHKTLGVYAEVWL